MDITESRLLTNDSARLAILADLATIASLAIRDAVRTVLKSTADYPRGDSYSMLNAFVTDCTVM